MHDVHDVGDWPQDHALTAGVAATTLGDDARRGAGIGIDLWYYIWVIDLDVFGSLAQHLGRVGLNELASQSCRFGRTGRQRQAGRMAVDVDSVHGGNVDRREGLRR